MRVGECLQRPQHLIAGQCNRDSHIVFYLSYVSKFLHMKDRVSISILKAEDHPLFYGLLACPEEAAALKSGDGAFRENACRPSKLLEIFDQRPALVIVKVLAEIVPGVAVAGLGSRAHHELAVLERRAVSYVTDIDVIIDLAADHEGRLPSCWR